MVKAAEHAATFERKDVRGLLNDTEAGSVTSRVRADSALVGLRKEAASQARSNAGNCFYNGFRDLIGACFLFLNDPERDSLCASRSDPGHAAQLANQFLDQRRVIDPLHPWNLK